MRSVFSFLSLSHIGNGSLNETAANLILSSSQSRIRMLLTHPLPSAVPPAHATLSPPLAHEMLSTSPGAVYASSGSNLCGIDPEDLEPSAEPTPPA
jgi:hypothetical protein